MNRATILGLPVKAFPLSGKDLSQHTRIADNEKLLRPNVALEHAPVDDTELPQALRHVVRHVQM